MERLSLWEWQLVEMESVMDWRSGKRGRWCRGYTESYHDRVPKLFLSFFAHGVIIMW